MEKVTMKFFHLIKRAAGDFSDDDCMSSGAAIAYYTIFSLPPLLVLVFFAADAMGVSHEQISRIVENQIGLPVGGESSGEETESQGGSLESVAGAAQSGATVSALGPFARIAGILLLVFSATGVFAQLQYALNRAWEVEPDPAQGGVWRFLFKRVLSLGMIVVLAFLLLVSMVLTTLIDEIAHMVIGEDPGKIGVVIGELINNGIALVVATLLFAAMFKLLPDAKMRWKDVWVGAFITALLFVIGKTLIGLYLQNSDVGSVWGEAAASMIGMLVWVYYTSLIVLFGAEMTQVWANEYGAGVEPAKGAVGKVEEKRHIRGGQAHPA
jgi:membrane protein